MKTVNLKAKLEYTMKNSIDIIPGDGYSQDKLKYFGKLKQLASKIVHHLSPRMVN
jgi:hypothetical protein